MPAFFLRSYYVKDLLTVNTPRIVKKKIVIYCGPCASFGIMRFSLNITFPDNMGAEVEILQNLILEILEILIILLALKIILELHQTATIGGRKHQSIYLIFFPTIQQHQSIYLKFYFFPTIQHL